MARKNPHAVALGRRGGRVTSPAKTRAVRANAMKGGRKPKFQIGDQVLANDHAPGDYRERRGHVAAYGAAKSEYVVAFVEESGFPATGHMMSWWLDPA
jgi:hypothetical protein